VIFVSDFICAFIYRPRHMDAVEFAEAQLSVRQRVNDLIEIGELLKVERAQKAEQGERKARGEGYGTKISMYIYSGGTVEFKSK